MASDDVNITEDAEMADYDGDKVVTMMDVLQEQQEFEDDVNAVLGASDDKNCTYPKGYIKRQALYACLTCCTEAKTDPTKRAGVCLACSLTCHENHELIELYTKRNFRCDCGNPKFNSHPCQFTSSKNDLNDENIYNQNFSGLYCICHRPYPDPDSTLEDDMIQCIICEDWLHASHLEATVPANDQYSEMVCKGCMEKNEFLHDYSAFAVNLDSDVDVITGNGHTDSADDSLCNGELGKEKLVNGDPENNTETKATDDVKLNGDVEMNGDGKKSEDNAVTSTENDKVDESIPPQTSDKAKEDETSNLESTETKPENEGTENADNINSMELDTESKIAAKDEQSEETTETNKQTESQKSTTNSEEPNAYNDEMESQEETDLTKLTTDDTETNNKTENDDKTVSTDKIEDGTNEEISNTDKELEKMDDSKEDNETQEQNNEQSIVEEKGDGDNAHNMTDSTKKTEQQLLDDLSALTADNPTSEEKNSTTEEKPVDNSETSRESKKNEDNADIDDKVPEETKCGGGDSSEVTAQTEAKPDNSNIEVSDTSQSEQVKENDEEKSDSVMDAIDELLDTANETKQSESLEENKENASESTETKINTENIENKQSDDVEMGENKPEADVPEKPEETVNQNEKTSADVEISDNTSQNEPAVTDSKMDSETATESTKDDDCLENSDSKTSVDADKTNMDESSKDDEKASEINDTATDNSKENEASNKPGEKLQQNEESTNENKSETENTGDHKRKLSVDLTEDVSSKKAKIEEECVRPKGVKRVHKGATFWPINFRQKLCTCGECILMYKDLHVLFLNDLEDTVSAYESLGKENVAGGASQYEKGLQALSSLDRIQQINALTEYNKMRDKLLDFLKSFKDRKEIVKEEDIKAFFAGMKPRREPDGVYFCR